MRPVTERRIARLLATTEKYLPRLSGLVFDRRKIRAFVRTIAKRLVFAAAACAPKIDFPRFLFFHHRGFLCNYCVAHIFFRCSVSCAATYTAMSLRLPNGGMSVRSQSGNRICSADVNRHAHYPLIYGNKIAINPPAGNTHIGENS